MVSREPVDSGDTKVVGSAERTLLLLQLLAKSGRAMTLAELAASLNLPKGTVHRLCARLLELGYIIREVDDRFYTIGPAMRQVAFDTLNHGAQNGLRHTVLLDLVADVGESCNFTTLDGNSVLYLDRVEAKRPWRLTLDIGVHVPLHCTASGKLFLSQMTPDERTYLLKHTQLEKLTPNTLVTKKSLDKSIAEIKTRGYAIENEEFVTGLVALAVPVFDKSSDSIRAAIAMHWPTSHATLKQAIKKLPRLKLAAKRMTALL